jgi:hypothetical protein
MPAAASDFQIPEKNALWPSQRHNGTEEEDVQDMTLAGSKGSGGNDPAKQPG